MLRAYFWEVRNDFHYGFVDPPRERVTRTCFLLDQLQWWCQFCSSRLLLIFFTQGPNLGTLPVLISHTEIRLLILYLSFLQRFTPQKSNATQKITNIVRDSLLKLSCHAYMLTRGQSDCWLVCQLQVFVWSSYTWEYMLMPAVLIFLSSNHTRAWTYIDLSYMLIHLKVASNLWLMRANKKVKGLTNNSQSKKRLF